MKIGTDGVLLGAWASVDHHPENILDIGAGTGVIALMLAQRSAAENIEALEIDEDAFEQAVHPIDEQIEVNTRQSVTLAAIRDALLPKLLSGELRLAEMEGAL